MRPSRSSADEALGVGLVADDDAVAEDVAGEALDVVGRDVVAAREQRVRLRRADEGERRAGAGPQLDQRGQARGRSASGSRVARTRSTMYSLIAGATRTSASPGAQLADLGRAEERRRSSRSERRVADAGQVEHRQLGGAVGIADEQLHQEAVELGLGQRIGPLVLDRVLGGQDEERVGQADRLVADGDLAFLHRLQQGAGPWPGRG